MKKIILIVITLCSASLASAFLGFGSKDKSSQETQTTSSSGGSFFDRFRRSSGPSSSTFGSSTNQRSGFFSGFGRSSSSSQPQGPREKQTLFEKLRGKPSPAQLQREEREEKERREKNRLFAEGLKQETIAREKTARQPLDNFISELIREVNKQSSRDQKLQKARRLIDMNGNLIRKFGIETQTSKGSLCSVLTRLFDAYQASDLLRTFTSALFEACKKY